MSGRALSVVVPLTRVDVLGARFEAEKDRRCRQILALRRRYPMAMRFAGVRIEAAGLPGRALSGVVPLTKLKVWKRDDSWDVGQSSAFDNS